MDARLTKLKGFEARPQQISMAGHIKRNNK